MEKAVIFDVEGDGLTPKKLHCLSFSDEDGKNVETIFDYDGMRTFFTSYDIYIGHNIRRWDIPVIERILGIEIKGLIIDTLALSWYLQPKRPKHNLESYGEEYGIKKPAIPDWADLAKEVYRNRCEQDVKINKRVWQDQIKYLTKLYPDRDDLIPFLRYLSFKMYAAHLAEKSRWKLDVERCNASLQRLNLERTQKLDELKKVMPSVPVIKSHVAPKRMYNADGQLSLLGQKWTDRLVAGGFDEGYEGPIEEISGYDEPNPSSHKQVKDWLYSLGWVPQTIKYQKNKETGEIKEIPQINKEHGAGICESIKDLYEKEPRLELLDGLSVLSHRISLLNGFLRDVDDEGYIRAAVQGLTNTLRFKHAVVVNLPKVGVAYGDDIRGCLIADSGNELCGADMSSLEDRIKQHFIYKHDPDYVDELNRSDYDPHLDLAYVVNQIDAKLGLTAEQVQTYKDGKDDGTIKKARGIFKNGNYACQYGAGADRLVITCNIDLSSAKLLHEAYWKRNWAIKAVADEQTIKTIAGQMWLFNPISGFWYSLRTKKDVFSTLVQGSASYCFDTWVSHILADRPQLTAQFHDEVVLEVKKDHRPEIEEFLEQTMKDTNEFLGLNRELGIGIEFGSNYAEIH